VGSKATKSATPAKADHAMIVLPWLKGPMQRFVLPNWLAITIGRKIFAWRDLDEIELAHELAHVKQWQQYGLTFVVRYFQASRAALAAGGDRYRDNVFEKEAVDAEEKARKHEDR
jgi:hypothetical protein